MQTTTLGRTGVRVGRMGIASSYGVPAKAVERAFEHGVNYLYWGSLRRRAFAEAIRNLRAQRERLVIVLQSYWPYPFLVRRSVERGLRSLGLDYADVLLLGKWDRPITEAILEECSRLKEQGRIRFTGMSTHQRSMIAAQADRLDVVHLRYSAVHTGAEQDVFPLLPRARPGLVAYTATSWGQLLSYRRGAPKTEPLPTAADCYRFVLANSVVDVCMSGPSNAQHVEAVIEAMAKGPLDSEQIAWMRRAGVALYQP